VTNGLKIVIFSYPLHNKYPQAVNLAAIFRFTRTVYATAFDTLKKTFYRPDTLGKFIKILCN